MKMTIQLVCFGVRDVEVEFFNSLNKYNFDLTLIEELMNDENVEQCKGADAVMIRGNCKADRANLTKLAGYGIRYILTRTVGYNHIDLEAAAELELKVARVPAYSPNAISELALNLGINLLRNIPYTTAKTHQKDFTVDAMMFSKEIRKSTIGILGTGKIGLTTAKLFKGLGARVVAYDIYESEAARGIVEYLPLEEVLAISDVVSAHVPHFKGVNDHFINEAFINKMKDGAVLINTSRGEIQDHSAILHALKENKLSGYGTDVFEGEKDFFFRKLTGEKLDDPVIEELISLYPRVLVTPHIGSYTDEALTNMVEISYDNLHAYLMYGRCENEVPLPEIALV